MELPLSSQVRCVVERGLEDSTHRHIPIQGGTAEMDPIKDGPVLRRPSRIGRDGGVGGSSPLASRTGRMRHPLVLVFGLVLAGSIQLSTPLPASAQEGAPETRATPVPPKGFHLSIHSVLEHGEVLDRVGLWWSLGNRFSAGLTGRVWGGSDVIEPEIKVFPFLPENQPPFVSFSTVLDRDYNPRRIWVAVGVGIESHSRNWLASTTSLGWRRLISKDTKDGEGSGHGDRQGFRLRLGVMVFPGSLWGGGQ